MKRPIIIILLFAIFGIQIGYHISNFYMQILLLALCFLFSYLLHIKYDSYSGYKFIKYLGLFTLLFFVYTLNVKHKSDADVSSIIENGIDVEIYGMVKTIDISSTNRHKLLIDVDKISIDEVTVKKDIDVYTYAPLTKDLKIGDYVNISGNLAYPETNKNPNAYNESLVYKTKGIDYKMFGSSVDILSSDSFMSKINNVHQAIFKIYDEILPPSESGILKAMILGEKQFLDDDIKTTYQEVGIYHILAISGLHIGILCVILNKIFSKFRHGKIFVIVILMCYCAFTGGSISTVRACIMCITVLLAGIFYRNDDFLCSICFSAILVLLANPYYLFDVGFLYSYTAVLSIALLGARIPTFFEMNKVGNAFLSSFFVCLSLKPITAYYFYNFQTLDVILNLIILPFMSLLVFVGFMSTIVGVFSVTLAEFCIGTVYFILKFFTYISSLFNKFPLSNVIVGRPSIIFIVCFYIMLLCISYTFYDRYKFYKRKNFINFGILIFIICVSIFLIKPSKLTVTMLDVGQGDSIVCEYGNISFLIDGGGERYYAVGDNIVLPYLNSRGITNLDFVFVSHIDTDHINGIIEIADSIEIEKIFLPKTTSKDGKFIELSEVASENNIPMYYVEAGDSVYISDNFYIEILHPSVDFTRNDNNENSIVCKMTYYETSILFTGDVEQYGEKFMLNNNVDVSADILKVGHHGSKTSTTENFLNAVAPKIALISCKENNMYNHPSESVIESLENNEVDIYRTDLQDAIVLDIGKSGNISIKTIN